MIPKKIHYCWFGGKPLPKDVKKCIKSWKKFCPDYEIIEWNESNFDINCNNFVTNAYKEKCWAFVSDYARLKIIYENGGIYLDTDVELLKSLDPLLTNNCFFPTQQLDHKVTTGLGYGAEKNHQIIKEMIKIYDKMDFDKNNLDSIICPIINTSILEKYGYTYSEDIQNLSKIKTTIYPPKFFDPISPGINNNLKDQDTFSIHHYSASWTSNKQQLKRKISRFIGQKNINKIKKIIKR